MKSARYPMLVAVAAALIYVILHPLSWHKPKSDTTFTFEQRSADATPLPAGEQLNAEMRVLADKAVENARAHHGVALDYSEPSISKVDDILGKLHDRHLSHDELSPYVFHYGAYIGEVLRMNGKGHWERVAFDPKVWGGSGEQFGMRQPSGSISFPVNKVYKRIVNGDEDNVDAFYRLAIRDFKVPSSKSK